MGPGCEFLKGLKELENNLGLVICKGDYALVLFPELDLTGEPKVKAMFVSPKEKLEGYVAFYELVDVVEKYKLFKEVLNRIIKELIENPEPIEIKEEVLVHFVYSLRYIGIEALLREKVLDVVREIKFYSAEGERFVSLSFHDGYLELIKIFVDVLLEKLKASLKSNAHLEPNIIRVDVPRMSRSN